jgi:hypothetical protein
MIARGNADFSAIRSYSVHAEQGGDMDDEIDRLTRDGSIPPEAYRVMRDAIARPGRKAAGSMRPAMRRITRRSPPSWR